MSQDPTARGCGLNTLSARRWHSGRSDGDELVRAVYGPTVAALRQLEPEAVFAAV